MLMCVKELKKTQTFYTQRLKSLGILQSTITLLDNLPPQPQRLVHFSNRNFLTTYHMIIVSGLFYVKNLI